MPTLMDKVNIWYNANGTPVEQKYFPEAAAQTFKRGDLLIFSAGGAAQAVAIGSNVGAVKIIGIAGADASGVTGNLVPVILPKEGLRWVIPVSTSAGAIGSTANSSNADMGVAHEVSHIAAGKWAVDVNATGNAFVIPTMIHPQYGVFNTNAGIKTGAGSTEPFGWYECAFNQALVDFAV